jgi:hypothetical protein
MSNSSHSEGGMAEYLDSASAGLEPASEVTLTPVAQYRAIDLTKTGRLEILGDVSLMLGIGFGKVSFAVISRKEIQIVGIGGVSHRV